MHMSKFKFGKKVLRQDDLCGLDILNVLRVQLITFVYTVLHIT